MVVQLLVGPLLSLLGWVVGRVIDYAAPITATVAGVYLADRLGVIDASAILTDLANQFLPSFDAGTLFDALAVIV